MGGAGSVLRDEDGRGFNQPKKVDPKLRERLGIFEEEEDVRSPAVISMDDPNSYSRYQFDVFRDFKDLSSEKNYERIPLNVLHNVFLFLSPGDLISLFSMCRYFHKAGLDNVFWKKFYINFFEISASEVEGMMDDLNYKKQFFKRFSDCRCANLHYLKHHQPIFTSPDDNFEDLLKKVLEDETGEKYRQFNQLMKDSTEYKYCDEYSYTICGPPGCGKRSLLARLWRKSYGDEELKKKAGEYKLYFNVVKRKYRQQNHPEDEKEEEEEEGEKKIIHKESFQRIRILSCTSKDLTAVKKLKKEERVSDPLSKRIKDIKWNSGSFLFCFTAGDKESFNEVKKFVKLFSDKMKRNVPSKQRKRGILVGLKSDLLGEMKKKKKKKVVTKKEILKFINSMNLKGYVETSAKEDTSCYLPIGILVEKLAWRFSRTAG